MLLFVPIIGPFLALVTALFALHAVGTAFNIDLVLGPLNIINTLAPSGIAAVILMALAF